MLLIISVINVFKGKVKFLDWLTLQVGETCDYLINCIRHFIDRLFFFWGVQQLPNCGTGCGLNPQPTSGGGSVKDDSGTLCTSEEEGLSGRVVANLQSLLTARPHTADI